MKSIIPKTFSVINKKAYRRTMREIVRASGYPYELIEVVVRFS